MYMDGPTSRQTTKQPARVSGRNTTNIEIPSDIPENLSDIELEAVSDSEHLYIISAGEYHDDDNSDDDNDSNSEEGPFNVEESTVTAESHSPAADKQPATAAVSAAKNPSDAIKDILTLRLVFPAEDGGMLIGKNGRHIIKLKESTRANWFITANSSNFEDRIVVIRGTIDNIAHAVHTLAEHINHEQSVGEKNTPPQQQQQQQKTILPLRFLFPTKIIGFILGSGGSRIEKLRQISGINRVHISNTPIPFTHERIVEITGTDDGLRAATTGLLQATESELTRMQDVATLYKPTKNGLNLFLAQEKILIGGLGPSRSAFDGDHGRKRSRSALVVEQKDSAQRAYSGGKRLRRSSDNAESRGSPAKYIWSTERSPVRAKDGRDTSSSSSSRNSNDNGRCSRGTEEKLVIPDFIAGRLIGRNGCHLERIKSDSGASIHLSPRVRNMPDRVVTIIGLSDEVRSARKLISETMRHFEDKEV
ncbi:RNA binding protein, heterogenous nuclear RNP-K like protein [Kickxella alabastrina]|uniref:RNA binding protein, heterogenous nuclear RNP-K like protein n=1 Tax=Kickxella alabastrina TaxID=61397 RepID=A0ACC1IG76_9FUNG|nr:RNA binding protein, heterogenous nuclear RNP-K like protein [Kickxella alabastrina]